MAKASKKNQFKLSIPSGRELLSSTARRLSRQRIIPSFIRQRLKRTSSQAAQSANNRRQKITPELQAYIQDIDVNKETSETEINNELKESKTKVSLFSFPLEEKQPELRKKMDNCSSSKCR